MSLTNKIILITGGASGIGKQMSQILLKKNNTVIIWDKNKVALDKTMNELKALGMIYGFCVDITKNEAITESMDQIFNEIGPVDVLINNAGIVIGKYFHEHTYTDIRLTLEVNTIAPIALANEVLKRMIDRNTGYICNIASSAGIISNPKMSVYAGSKWSIVGWSDSVRLEMKQLKKNIHITTVMPYYINTGMFRGVQSRIPILDPDIVAKTIINGIEKKRKLFTIPGYLYRMTRLAQALLSLSLFDFLADSVLGIYHTMENFKGHIKS